MVVILRRTDPRYLCKIFIIYIINNITEKSSERKTILTNNARNSFLRFSCYSCSGVDLVASKFKVNVNNQRNSLHLSDIKIVSLNVCGLCSKLQNPDFLELINEHDIVYLTETKTDCADVIDVENYTVISKHRSNISTHKSGGIVVYVRNTLSKFVSLITNGRDHVFMD